VISIGSTRNEGQLLVSECRIDLRVAASVKLPHLEGDLATFGVALSRLIPLVELADFIVDLREESVLDAIVLLSILCVSLYQLRRAQARK